MDLPLRVARWQLDAVHGRDLQISDFGCSLGWIEYQKAANGTEVAGFGLLLRVSHGPQFLDGTRERIRHNSRMVLIALSSRVTI